MEPNNENKDEVVEAEVVDTKKNKKKKEKKPKKERNNTRNTLNEKKAKLQDSLNDEIEKASKDMEELMQSIQDEMGDSNVKVVRIQLPKPSFKNFLLETVVCILVNMLLILGTSGFIHFLEFDSILALVLYSLYYSVVDRLLVFIFTKFFMPLIIRTMGLASLIPPILSLVICMFFPIFVGIENIPVAILAMIFVSICRSFIVNYVRNKIIINKIRRKK